MILIIDNHSKNMGKLIEILKDQKTKFIIKDQKSFLDDLKEKEIKGVILSGGDPSLNKKIKIDQIRSDISSILNFEVPILGICEGFQIIAQIYGGDIKKLEKPSINKKNKIKILNKTKIFEKIPSNIEVYEHHKNYVSKLPLNLEITASSSKDKIESFFDKEKPIFGVSFHPEESGEIGKKMINNFLEICKDK